MSTGDVRRVVRVAKLLGFSISRTSRGHLRFDRPGTPAVFFSGTPGDWRAVLNGIAKLKRAAKPTEPNIQE